MDFRALSKEETDRLRTALLGNAESNEPIYMGRDTTFHPQNRISGLVTPDEVSDQEVVNCIRSVPCHY